MGLTGGLDELGLPDLVEMIALGGKTGRLDLRSAGGSAGGRVEFRGGRLTGATWGPLRAERAFYSLLSLKDGTFTFDPQAKLDDETCNLPTESLLMEGMRRIDEIRRLRRALPAPATVRLLTGTVEGEAADVTTEDAQEARVLAYLGPGARSVGDIVDGVLVGGEADEYDVLAALSRLADRAVVRVEVVHGREAAGPPQPELEA